MIQAVAYARVSTKDQEREGYSIPAQVELLHRYAKTHKFMIVHEFIESESAGDSGRRQFGEMVELLKHDSSIKAILVEKTDRLYRNFKDQVLLNDLGIEIHFVKDGRIIGKNSKSSDRFVHDIEVAQARFYLNNLSEEVKKGQRQKAKQGKYPGGIVPLGYMRNPIDKSIELDPVRSPIIRHLFELYSQGQYSLTEVHEVAKKNGLTYRKTGRPLVRSAIERMLKTSFYSGKFKWKGTLYHGDHPAIVDPVLFEKVQDAFKARTNFKSGSRGFTFSRLVTCGECGHMITAELKKGRYVYYHCTGYGNKHKPIYIPESKMDAQFAKIVGEATIPFEFYEFLKVSLESELESQKLHIARERDRLETARDKLQVDMKKAFQAHLDGLIGDDFYKEVHNDYQNQLDAISYRLANLRELITEKFDDALKSIELSHRAESLYVRAKSNQKRELLLSVLSSCQMKNGTLYPTYNNLIGILVEGKQTGLWRRR
ncbi:MAG: recombinase family protein [Candidatus Zixiibacteriota bacterium]